jgi:hypothetical protein
MKLTLMLPMALALVSCAVAFTANASGHAEKEAPPVFPGKIPEGYRGWPLVSVAREEGKLDDIRAILGNAVSIRAFKQGKLPFPNGSIVVRIAWSYDASEENNKAFGHPQSFVAGHPKNGVQFMVKDSKKYASTGGWGYAQFDEGKLADQSVLNNCFPCHQAMKARDYVFTRYAD